MDYPFRRGFTLVELLVVIAIIGIIGIRSTKHQGVLNMEQFDVPSKKLQVRLRSTVHTVSMDWPNFLPFASSRTQ